MTACIAELQDPRRFAAAWQIRLHAGACSGHFAIVNWLWLNGRSGDIYTYDDVAEGCTYFFRQR